MQKAAAKTNKRTTRSVVVLQADRILDEVTKQLDTDAYWLELVDACKGAKPSKRLHLAVFVEPYLKYVLEGKKKIESRFSINKVAPHWQVHDGDIILIKEASGPIVGMSAVLKSWSYQIDRHSLEGIRNKFGKQLYVDDPQFWNSRSEARYATLILLTEARRITPIQIRKSDRRGWVILSGPKLSQSRLFDE